MIKADFFFSMILGKAHIKCSSLMIFSLLSLFM